MWVPTEQHSKGGGNSRHSFVKRRIQRYPAQHGEHLVHEATRYSRAESMTRINGKEDIGSCSLKVPMESTGNGARNDSDSDIVG